MTPTAATACLYNPVRHPFISPFVSSTVMFLLWFPFSDIFPISLLLPPPNFDFLRSVFLVSTSTVYPLLCLRRFGPLSGHGLPDLLPPTFSIPCCRIRVPYLQQVYAIPSKQHLPFYFQAFPRGLFLRNTPPPPFAVLRGARTIQAMGQPTMSIWLSVLINSHQVQFFPFDVYMLLFLRTNSTLFLLHNLRILSILYNYTFFF